MSATPLTLQQQYDILYVRRHESVLYRGGVAPNEQLFNKITNETGVPLDTVKLAFDRRVNFRIDDPNFRTYFDLIKMGKRVNLQETKQELYKGITEQKPSETTTESRIYQPSKYEQLMSELNEIKPFDERVSHLLKEWGEKLYFIEVRMRHKDPHDERLINFSKSMNQKYQEQLGGHLG